jgi:hypothetical protein
MSSALFQELEEGVQALGEQRMRYYKIMSLFSFENGNEIHFGDGLSSFCTDRDQYEKLKEYIKEQKKWVRSTSESIHSLVLRLWWLRVKLIEFGVFTPSELRTVFLLFDV